MVKLVLSRKASDDVLGLQLALGPTPLVEAGRESRDGGTTPHQLIYNHKTLVELSKWVLENRDEVERCEVGKSSIERKRDVSEMWSELPSELRSCHLTGLLPTQTQLCLRYKI
jgi:hypothetical protein